ncbi:MAG: type II toxin-antitoxin system YafQ family toxin [Muribaculum sp.]|nr:type II toxin-antitoxin system YafQ family toxin [Muribaculum sp.]
MTPLRKSETETPSHTNLSTIFYQASAVKYRIETPASFTKALKRCLKRGLKYENFEYVVKMLAKSGNLPPKYRQHKLSGKYDGLWECHIQPDWLLIWRQDDEELVLVMINTGSHSDLF